MNRWSPIQTADETTTLPVRVIALSGGSEAVGASPVEWPRLPLAPALDRRRLQVYCVLMLVDAAAIVAGFALAGFVYFGVSLSPAVLLQAQLVVPFYWTAAIGNKAYAAGAALKPSIGAVRALLALAIASALVVFLAFYFKNSAQFSRVVTGLGTLAAATGIVMGRDLLSRFAHWRCGPTGMNQLVILDGGQPVQVPHSHVLDADSLGLSPDLNNPHTLNRLGLVLCNMDRVIVSCAPERRKAWSMVLKGANILGEILDEDIVALGAIGANRTEHYSALVITTGPLGLSNRIMKRLLDLGISAVSLVLLLPLLLLVALAIKLEDRGPVLFVQRRLGRGNRFFKMYKFRSMRAADGDADGDCSTARNDQRVTAVGQFLRRTSIDELPQLLNIAKGEMSLVGPRPHALGSHAGAKLFWEVDERYWQRHALKPGLTGLAQVRGLRGATEHEHDLSSRLQSDLEYIDGWTIWRDLAILAATLRVVVHDNAY